MTKEKQNDAMPSKGVRLRVDQWEDCDRFSETLKMASRNDFIRDAIDFYLEYLRRNNSVKFLTPALESVISAKVRDSEERLARLLFKLAVEQNVNNHILASDTDIDAARYMKMHTLSMDQVRGTNGKISFVDVLQQEKAL